MWRARESVPGRGNSDYKGLWKERAWWILVVLEIYRCLGWLKWTWRKWHKMWLNMRLVGSGTKFRFYSWYNKKTFKGLKQGGSMMWLKFSLDCLGAEWRRDWGLNKEIRRLIRTLLLWFRRKRIVARCWTGLGRWRKWVDLKLEFMGTPNGLDMRYQGKRGGKDDAYFLDWMSV